MTTENIAHIAAAKLDADRNARIAAVEALAESAAKLSHARAALGQAEQRHLQSFRDAVKIGWTSADIKDFGIEVPTKNLGGRPRKQKSAGSRTATGLRSVSLVEQHEPTNFGGLNGPSDGSDS